MKADVQYRGKPVGTLEWTEDAYGAAVTLDCAMPSDPLTLLRCYGRTGNGGNLLIGLPEPQGGRLRLKRRLTRETLKAAGCDHTVPQDFYLALQPEEGTTEDRQEPPKEKPMEPVTSAEPAAQTGEPLLDALIREGMVECERHGNDMLLSCPFLDDQPFALAPLFVLCSVESGRALLRWNSEKNPPCE